MDRSDERRARCVIRRYRGTRLAREIGPVTYHHANLSRGDENRAVTLAARENIGDECLLSSINEYA